MIEQYKNKSKLIRPGLRARVLPHDATIDEAGPLINRRKAEGLIQGSAVALDI